MSEFAMTNETQAGRAVLSCRNLGKSYDEGPQAVVVLADLQLELLPGERVAIVSGLEPEAPIVASGVGFLADGDLDFLVHHEFDVLRRSGRRLRRRQSTADFAIRGPHLRLA